MLNTECPICHKMFHSCRSCDHSWDWEDIYCSFKCFKESQSYKECVYFIEKYEFTLDEIEFISKNKEIFWLIYLNKKIQIK